MTASIIFGTLFLLVTFVCMKVQRDVLHPAVVFPAVWGATLIMVGFAEPFGYFQISVNTFFVFTVGIFMFVAGATTINNTSTYKYQRSIYNLDFRKIIWFCFLFHAVILPMAWFEIGKIGAGVGADNIFALAYRLRVASVSGEENVGPIVGNYLIGGLFFIPVLLLGWMHRQISFLCMVLLGLPWVMLNILVNGRSGIILLTFSIFYIYLSFKGKFSVKAILSFGIFFVAVLIAGNLLVGKIDAGIDDGLWIIARQSIRSFFDYLLQGPILFSRYVENPNEISPTWDALIFPCHLLNKFDLCVLPSLYQDFLDFSLEGEPGNVYSIFLSVYPKYGILGAVLIFYTYGVWAAFHHARRYSSLWHLLIASFLFSAIMLSVFNDGFGPNIYFFVKIILISVAASYVFKKT